MSEQGSTGKSIWFCIYLKIPFDNHRSTEPNSVTWNSGLFLEMLIFCPWKLNAVCSECGTMWALVWRRREGEILSLQYFFKWLLYIQCKNCSVWALNSGERVFTSCLTGSRDFHVSWAAAVRQAWESNSWFLLGRKLMTQFMCMKKRENIKLANLIMKDLLLSRRSGGFSWMHF